jgi:hypothetical protein
MCDRGVFGDPELDVSAGRQDSGRPGLALVVVSVVEQRLEAVRTVPDGVVDISAELFAARPSVRGILRWDGRQRNAGRGLYGYAAPHVPTGPVCSLLGP